MNSLKKIIICVLLIILYWQFAFSYHGTVMNLDFKGWTDDSTKCIFYTKVITDESETFKDEFIIVHIAGSGLNIERHDISEAEKLIKKMNLIKTISLTPVEQKRKLVWGTTSYFGNPCKFRLPPNKFKGDQCIFFDSDTVLESIEQGSNTYEFTINRRIWFYEEKILFKEKIEDRENWRPREEGIMEAHISPDETKLFLYIYNDGYDKWPSFCIIDLNKMEVVGNKIFDLLK